MARNVMHDHRVSLIREQSFDALNGHPRTDAALRNALIDHKESHIKTSAAPEFIDAKLNGNNIVSGSPSVRQVIHKDARLVRVLDINGLTPIFQWAKRRGYAAFASFPTGASGTTVDGWLTDVIRRTPHERFVKACLDAMNDYCLHLPYHPTWAAAWQKFEPFVKEGADRWLQVMGMHRPFPGRWLMLLRYLVREAGTVARPTQLEAGWGPHHFPSPPRARMRRGGHPMDLDVSGTPTGLLSEFVHQQISHTVDHWRDTASSIERTSGPTSGSLDIQRNGHHQRLILHYGRSVLHWMPRCV